MNTDNSLLLTAATFVLDLCYSQKAMWVSAAGGTANVLAGELSRFTGASFDAAHAALDMAGGPDWYEMLPAHFNPFDYTDWTDAKGVGKALSRRFNTANIPLAFEDMDILPPTRKGLE